MTKTKDKKNESVTIKTPIKKIIKLTEPNISGLTKSAEEYQRAKHAGKVRNVVFFCLFTAIVVAVFVLAFLTTEIFGANSKITNFINIQFFNKGGEGNAYLRTVIYIAVGYIIITLLEVLIELFAVKGSKRRKTIVTLIKSLAKYIGYAVLLVLLLKVWKVDSSIIAALIAALGIAIGFGAQDLIGDLLAGLFLIFENTMKVGDIVTFEDFRGEVVEVGIRTTRLRSGLGDVKIINNSELNKFINMSMHRSIAVCNITIDNHENLERVEKIIKDSLPKIAEKLTAINDGPWYGGLGEFNDKGISLMVTAKCLEQDRFQVVRDLNREFKLIFDKNKIKIAVRKIEVINSKPRS